MGWVVNATSRPLYPRERSRTHCIRGWVGLRVGLDGCGKCRIHRDSIPDRPARSGSLNNVHSNNDLWQRPAPPWKAGGSAGGGEGLIEDISNRRLHEGVQQQAPFYMMVLITSMSSWTKAVYKHSTIWYR